MNTRLSLVLGTKMNENRRIQTSGKPEVNLRIKGPVSYRGHGPEMGKDDNRAELASGGMLSDWNNQLVGGSGIRSEQDGFPETIKRSEERNRDESF